MTYPVYKIETYTGETLDRTITKNVMVLRFKETLTTNVGTFTFTVPSVKGVPNPYYYNDIALWDKVKIWVGYDSVSGDPNFVGRILRISSPLATETGYLRTFQGRSQGEILKRRLKRQKQWSATDASVIVEAIADDLGLGKTEIGADATDEDITVEDETYLDLLKRVSDYWYDAGTQVKKDFYVNVDNDLVWKLRPFRTSGVETLTVGDNIIRYDVLRDLENVKNTVYVYGKGEQAKPTSKDAWTETTTGWTGSHAPVDTDVTNKVFGSYSIGDQATTNELWTRYDCTTTACKFKNQYQNLIFHLYLESTGTIDKFEVELYATDSSNTFKRTYDSDDLVLGSWRELNLPLGDNNGWTVTGSPDWEQIEQIKFLMHSTASVSNLLLVDGLHFIGARYYATASDAGSIASYGTRELVYVDDQLTDANQCSRRANTLIYQLKEPAIRLDIITPGNTNILIGDRVSMTIPAEDITSTNFDVVTVEHVIAPAPVGFRTTATMVNSANIRDLPPTSPRELLNRKFHRLLAEVAKGASIIK